MLFDIAILVIAAPLRASDVVVRLGRLSGLALLGLLGLLGLLALGVVCVRLVLALTLRVLLVGRSIWRALRSGTGAAPGLAVPTWPTPTVPPGSDHPKQQEEEACQEEQREQCE